MDRSASGELDMLPAKRKAPPNGEPCAAAERQPLSAAPAPAAAARACQRATPCPPTLSSPNFGCAWGGLHSRSGSGDVETDAEHDSCHSAALARGKALRVCCEAATGPSAGAAPCGPCCTAAADGHEPGATRPLCCPGGAAGGLRGCSLPPGLYRSYHAGCCSRLSSSSSLRELEAAAAAIAVGDGDDEAVPMEQCASAPMAAAAAAAAAAAVAAPSADLPAPPAEVTATGLACAAASRPQQGSWLPAAPCCGRGGGVAFGRQPMEEDGEEVSYWADIPDDMLKRVMERLQPSTLRVLRLVCHGWEAAASRLLTHLRPEAVVGKQLSRRFPALHSLDLSNAHMGVDLTTPRTLRLQSLLEDHHLAELTGLGRLEQLSLRGCTRLTGLGLAQLGRLCSLSMLNLSNCAGLSDACMAALAAALPQLATLNLQGCTRLGDEGVAHLAALPVLRHVLLPGGISDASLAALTGMPALERVSLRGCPRVTTAGVCLLLQRRGLKRVVISKCPNVTLESLCMGGMEPQLRVITEAAPAQHGAAAALVAAGLQAEGIAAVAAAAAAAAAVAAVAAVPQEMQMLVGDA